MAVLLQVDFPFTGPWGDEMAAGMKELATSIAQEPGLLWKIWTENRDTGEAGGIYLFADRADAERYLEMHRARLLYQILYGILQRINKCLLERFVHIFAYYVHIRIIAVG